VQERVKTKLFFANGDSQTARIQPDLSDKKQPAQNWSNPLEINQQKKTFFCLPDDFKIRQSFLNLAEETVIWQR
jgi:hypothetical protein